MNKLKEKYNKEIVPLLAKKFGLKSVMAVPKILKVTVNVGFGKNTKDTALVETILNTLQRITGQKPVSTLAKKSISNFKIRQGMPIGMMVTLRGERMFDFIEKMVNVSLARIRDFRGISAKAVDKNGNLAIGFQENVVFPEIKSDEVERLHGLEVAITTTAKDHEKGLALFKLLGFPFKNAD